jgi:2-keto-4-pentenoate hydratase/2-oxohepta-3-ene-1,7-dioic acid hydratase in catechol pathway
VKVCVYDDYRLGVLGSDGSVVDISKLAGPLAGTPWAMNELIARFGDVRQAIEELALAGDGAAIEDVVLRPPVPRPRQILAAPLNYGAHILELQDDDASEAREPDARELGFFVKAAGSISGPADPIELPALPHRVFHHECELAVVIGREARSVSPEAALEYVFGYTCLLDITMRMDDTHTEERTLRKSFHSFTPLGPVVVTSDEVGPPGHLHMRLWVNGELRQDASTADMICATEDLIARASRVVTLYPGDVYATGTPEGVGPIVPGDEVRIWIDRVGEMSLRVTQRPW